MTFSRRRALAAGLGLLTASGLVRSGLAAPAQQASHPEFYFGADLSYVNEMEDCGAIYRQGGKRVDPYQLFADTGHNLVRLRLWNNPDWTDDQYGNQRRS